VEGGDQAGVARRNPKRVLSLRRGVLSWSALHKAGGNKTREMDKERGGGGIASVGPAGECVIVEVVVALVVWCVAHMQTDRQATAE